MTTTTKITEWRVAIMSGEHSAPYAQGEDREMIARAFATALARYPLCAHEQVVLQKREVGPWEDTDA